LTTIPDRAAKLAVIKGALESANEWAAKYPLYAAKYPQSSVPDADVATMVFQQTSVALTVLAHLDDPGTILVHGSAEAMVEWQRLLADRDRVKAELDTLRLRLDVTTQDQQFARADRDQLAREVARLRGKLDWSVELDSANERIARLEDWIRDQHEADHEPACIAEGCDVCLFLSRLAPDAGPSHPEHRALNRE